jgi:guanine deaminase
MKSPRPVRVGLATDLGAGTSFSMLQTMNEAYKVAQLGANGCPRRWRSTWRRAVRRALYLEDRIGSLAPAWKPISSCWISGRRRSSISACAPAIR